MRWRPLLAPVGGLVTVLAGLLAFGDLNSNLIYYLTPAEAIEQRADLGEQRRFRLAGDVLPGSIHRSEQAVTFTVTRDGVDVPVLHTGAPPQLFQPGVPVVLEGRWDGETFSSDTMLIHHDEEYYPDGSDHRHHAEQPLGEDGSDLGRPGSAPADATTAP